MNPEMSTEAPITRYQHRTPLADTGWSYEPAGDDLVDAMRHVLGRFDHYICESEFFENDGENQFRGTHVLLFAVRPGVVHVVGATSFADRVRGSLCDGSVEDWKLHKLPGTLTPLDAVHAQLGNRIYNLLVRWGFSTLEEAIAVPDDGLRQLRGMGTKRLATLRGVAGIPDPPSLSTGRPTSAEVARDRWRYLTGHMQTATVERYREFVDALARSSIPMAAIEKISEALDNEPVPPADSTVTMLLETAREDQLLDHYIRTHRTES